MLTFHKIISGCELGDAEAWRAFLAEYTPVVLRLTRIYLPGLSDERALWRDSLAELARNDSESLRTFSHQSEREFLLDLRSFFFSRAALTLAPERANPPEFGLEAIRDLLSGMPLLHREMVFMKLAGYSDATLEQIFRIAPSVAAKSLARLAERYPAVAQRQEDGNLQPHAWLQLLSELRAARQESCPPARQFIRIQDGQLGWQDKEPAEKHVSECMSCLECWTALLEVSYWRRAAGSLSREEAEDFVKALPFSQQAAKPKSLFGRILSSA